ncbi:MFS transporter [Cytobacillus kochii]|uniref:MFS transporter n=1 Tax=Cytobacillus kochii TaxID=859143 RepID=UPI002E251CF4|nr:MFS transporter [Cytobacillus kochii]
MLHTRSFKILWLGNLISEFGGAIGGIINGLLLYELTGSKEWMATMWLCYFLPSLFIQSLSVPFLNNINKEKMLFVIQLFRSAVYLLPLLGSIVGINNITIVLLVILQCTIGILQPIYASISFALIPIYCEDNKLVSANSSLDATIRLMSFIAPGIASFFLLVFPLHFLYLLTTLLFLLSAFAIHQLPYTTTRSSVNKNKKSWLTAFVAGYQTFFSYPPIWKLTLLSSAVQFAVGATMVIKIPFFREELGGTSWEYALFAAAFPLGYVLGTFLLAKLPKNNVTLYLGLFGGGLSFMLLSLTPSITFALVSELLGGLLFPLFNAQSVAIFQRVAPRDQLVELSAIRLLFLRITMPLGILFASLPLPTRDIYLYIAGLIIFLAIVSFFKGARVSSKHLTT